MILESTGCPYHFDVVGFKKWTDEVKPASVPEWRGDFGNPPVLTSHDAAHALPDGTPPRHRQATATTPLPARACGGAGAGASAEGRLACRCACGSTPPRNTGVSP